LANVEKEIAGEILKASGLSAAKLGLRFDRVVGRVLGDLRAFAGGPAPTDRTVLVTVSAPIRLPAKTVEALRVEIRALLSAGRLGEDRRAAVLGNEVRLRLVETAPGRSLRLIGFVHNPDSEPKLLLDLAEQWLRAKAP
jgi:hypothetical protein